MNIVSLFSGFSGRVHRLQNGESSIVLVADQLELFTHSIDSSVGYVDPIQESKEEQQTKDGNDPDVDLPDQRRLVDIWEHLLGGGLSIVSEMGELLVSRGSWGTQS